MCNYVAYNRYLWTLFFFTFILYNSRESNIRTLLYPLNLEEAINKSTTYNDMDFVSLHVFKWNRPYDVNMTLGGLA